MLKDLPFPYTSAAQHEHKLATPLGPEWSTSTVRHPLSPPSSSRSRSYRSRSRGLSRSDCAQGTGRARSARRESRWRPSAAASSRTRCLARDDDARADPLSLPCRSSGTRRFLPSSSSRASRSGLSTARWRSSSSLPPRPVTLPPRSTPPSLLCAHGPGERESDHLLERAARGSRAASGASSRRTTISRAPSVASRTQHPVARAGWHASLLACSKPRKSQA